MAQSRRQSETSQEIDRILRLSTGLSPILGINHRKKATNPYWGVKKLRFLVVK
jgi:hypothetical protein